ncbi:ankyrin repeat domain-containing protein 13D-like [Amphiura filiformis]|uniref:ankyrin repeat domain-containing protein 13D-like n=1 Tax=Amphiura filiformis TaxID=82378 RepID=UPI003B220D8A
MMEEAALLDEPAEPKIPDKLERKGAKLKELFPLHWCVWHNNIEELIKCLADKDNQQINVEQVDPRGRTPLHLAVTLGHLESARLLLRHNALVNVENKGGWTVLQEAISTGDPEIVQVVLQHRDHQRATARIGGIPELLEKLRQAPDFYVEMKWEFTSWVPLMSRVCPSDTYRVWKSGPNVRIDTTLIGFDNMKWIRGSRSFIFKNEEGHKFNFMEIDHDAQMVYSEALQLQPHHDLSRMNPSENSIAARLTSPVVNTFIDTEKIEFTRNKAGIWGWRHDKLENINEYECKVFSASNVQLITKTRTEHLTKEDKEKTKEQGAAAFVSPLQSLLGVVEQHEEEMGASLPDVCETGNPVNLTGIKPEEYFDCDMELGTRDVGRPKEVLNKVQKFRATLWLCEDHPLSMHEQVLPIIDLMAISNAHFAKLRDFITLQLPAGFPVKIEIPLFHILNACVTFGNLYGKREPVQGVTNVVVEDLSTQETTTQPTPIGRPDLPAELPVESETTGMGEDPAEVDVNPDDVPVKEPEPATICDVDPSVFDVPAGYGHYRAGQQVRYGEDELLQLAIQQSLMEQDGDQDQMAILDALGREQNMQSVEDRLLERAIQESLLVTPSGDSPNHAITNGRQEPTTLPVQPPELPPPRIPTEGVCSPDVDGELRMALEISEREMKEAEIRRKQEEEELERIIQLSLTEK